MSDSQNPYKAPPFPINGSDTFPVRGRCKYCSKCQLQYILDMSNHWHSLDWRNKTKNNNPRNVYQWINNVNTDFMTITKYSPDTYGGKWYTHSEEFNSYSPIGKRRAKWVSPDVIVVSCGNCGKSKWAILHDWNSELPEIKNRKARFDYPCKVKPQKNF